MFPHIHIETERLLLRPFSMDDLSALHAMTSHQEVVRYLPEGVWTLEETRKALRKVTDRYKRGQSIREAKYTLAVVERNTKKVIGWCGLGPMDFHQSEVEIYYGLSRDFWGRGIATEAAKALLHYAFQSIGLEKMVAIVKPENTASQRVIEKLGMIYRKRIGTLPEKFKFYQGLLYYSLTQEEYTRKAAKSCAK
jgi:ribosomal-protein-alanine N-acetyltransferase